MRGNQNQKHTQFYMHTDISRHFCVANITERIGYGIIHKVNTTTVKYETANLFFFLSFLFFFFAQRDGWKNHVNGSQTHITQTPHRTKKKEEEKLRPKTNFNDYHLFGSEVI